MKKVAILTDSTAYLPKAQIEQYGIATIPLAVIWGSETFEDGVTIAPETFYTKLSAAKIMPSTSQPSVGKMQEAFKNLLEQDFDVLGIFISAKLSGTMQSALQARELLPQGSRVEVFDSETTTVAMGFQVLAAARAAAEGASLDECKAVAESVRQHSGVYFMVDTLEFLHRGGRIGGGARFLGTALNMKPILYIHNGKIESLERVRTKGKALDRLTTIVLEKCAGKTPLRLAGAHANSLADVQDILSKTSERAKPLETFISDLSPVIGTHVGPGTVALAYQAGI